MKIAVHNRNKSFSDYWIKYLEENNISYIIVDAFDNNIIDILRHNEIDLFLWHYHHGIYSDMILAPNLLFALEHSGVKVFPNFSISWHFDNKLAQKYLFESFNIPSPQTNIFFNEKRALAWAQQIDYPIVAKLKGGAGASNVMLIHNFSQNKRHIKKSFNKGYSPINNWNGFIDHLNKFPAKTSFKNLVKSFLKLFVKSNNQKLLQREKGYVYYQEFIPNNNFDIRVIVVGEKAFAIKRLTRKGDFRASGSGFIVFDHLEIDLRCVKLAFEATRALKAASLGYDFVFDQNNNPLIVECSYGFTLKAYEQCDGYWDPDLNFTAGKIEYSKWLLDSLF